MLGVQVLLAVKSFAGTAHWYLMMRQLQTEHNLIDVSAKSHRPGYPSIRVSHAVPRSPLIAPYFQ
jgi:hypothetical protein